MNTIPLPQEYRLLKFFLAANFVAAAVFAGVAWLYIDASRLPLLYVMYAWTLAYSTALYFLVSPKNYPVMSVLFILLVLITDLPALFVHAAETFLLSYILVYTTLLVMHVILLPWRAVRIMSPLLLLLDLAVMLWPDGLFRHSARLVGLDPGYAAVAVGICHALILILGTGMIEVKRRTESQLRFMNANLNKLVEEKVAQIQRADREARQYQSQLEEILRHSPVGVVITDGHGQFLYTNGVHFQFEVAAGEAAERPGSPLPLRLLSDILAQATSRGRSDGDGDLVGQRLEYTAPDGSPKIIRYAYILVRLEGADEAGMRRVLITEDITQEENLRRGLMQTEHLAELGKMAASLAHEINNPLAGMKLYIELLEHDLAGPEKRKQIFSVLEASMVRIDRIVKSFLSFARQEKPRKESVCVAEVLQRTLDLAVNFKQFHQIHIATAFEDVPPIAADPYRLAQVFVNLLNNASDAMAETGGQLTIAVQRRQDEVFIIFRDTGKGIRREDLPHVFTPFFTTKERGQGTGLGLSTSYGIVKDHGGLLEVESREGAGSTFTIRLPLEKERKYEG